MSKQVFCKQIHCLFQPVTRFINVGWVWAEESFMWGHVGRKELCWRSFKRRQIERKLKTFPFAIISFDKRILLGSNDNELLKFGVTFSSEL